MEINGQINRKTNTNRHNHKPGIPPLIQKCLGSNGCRLVLVIGSLHAAWHPDTGEMSTVQYGRCCGPVQQLSCSPFLFCFSPNNILNLLLILNTLCAHFFFFFFFLLLRFKNTILCPREPEI